MVIISSVEQNSYADRAGICGGDVLVSVNGNEIFDVLDYRFYLTERNLALVLHRDGQSFEKEIRKGEYEDIGLEFDTPLMDKKRRCQNACIFCFIDQNPKGMRETIYFKDDDSRLSFLHGNYITMTNLSEHDVERIIKMHISPVRVSVHTTEKDLRCEMMKNRRAGECLSYLRRFADAGLEICAQIVLCKNVNDGEHLDRSMRDLCEYIPSLTSVSVVPVGLTRHREGLYPIEPFTAEDCENVISQVKKIGDECMEKYGSRIFFASDEFYLKSGKAIPDSEYYDGYPQIENGVGMLRSFEDECLDEISYIDRDKVRKRTVSVCTGAAAFDMLEGIKDLLAPIGIDAKIYKIRNDFYGESVTVSGLLTGGDIAAQLEGCELGEELFVPANALRSGEDIFLDDMTLSELSERLSVKVTPVGEDGCEFVSRLIGEIA
ncbi:MAG: DUF512 domain-containing protein [Ruminococcaceae bacterium]|nr:DUF512 domain-containing protein [Oscillospiraceae bacterium]